MAELNRRVFMRMRVERRRTVMLMILVGTSLLLAAPSNPAQTAESRLATQSDQFRRQLIKSNPAELFPLQDRERWRRIVDLVGGVPQLLDNVQRAIQIADYQWAAALVDHVLAIDPTHRDSRWFESE